jgi:enoyl-CoA hydratase/carnithine racemase
MENVLHVERHGGVVRAMLNRPEAGNCLSNTLVGALQALVDECVDTRAALLVLQGQGKHFCTGFDLSSLDDETDDTLLARFVRVELLLQAVYSAPFATVALGHGRIMGAGADLFAACEERIIVDDGNFSFPGAGFGLVLGTGRLARLVGAGVAREWVGSGRRIGADEALHRGLATRRIEAVQAADEIERIARRAQVLDDETRVAIYAASGQQAGLAAADLKALVDSAARPGIKERIVRYRRKAQEARANKAPISAAGAPARHA